MSAGLYIKSYAVAPLSQSDVMPNTSNFLTLALNAVTAGVLGGACGPGARTGVEEAVLHKGLEGDEQRVAAEGILAGVRREVLLIRRHQRQHLQREGEAVCGTALAMLAMRATRGTWRMRVTRVTRGMKGRRSYAPRGCAPRVKGGYSYPQRGLRMMPAGVSTGSPAYLGARRSAGAVKVRIECGQ